MTSQKFPHTFPMVGNTCTDELRTAATVHFLWAKWFVHACHCKVFTCSNYKGSGECEQSIDTVLLHNYVRTTVLTLAILTLSLLLCKFWCGSIGCFFHVNPCYYHTVQLQFHIIMDYHKDQCLVTQKEILCAIAWFCISHMHVMATSNIIMIVHA